MQLSLCSLNRCLKSPAFLGSGWDLHRHDHDDNEDDADGHDDENDDDDDDDDGTMTTAKLAGVLLIKPVYCVFGHNLCTLRKES